MSVLSRFIVALVALIALPAQAQDANPMVEIITNKGSLIVELYPNDAPKTVANFLQYVDDGHYDELIFHRVVPRFMVQGGGYDQDLARRATRAPIELESDNGLRHTTGTLSMARTDEPNSATSQFFINLVSNPRLNYRGENSPGYVVFGRLTKGFSVLRTIGLSETTQTGPFKNLPLDPTVIETVQRLN